MRALALSPVQRLAPAAPVVLRLVLGVVMAMHGFSKLTGGPANFGNNMLGGLGLPAPALLGYVVTFAELIGGLMLIVGLLTRVVAVVHAIILLVATLMVKLDVGLIAGPGSPMPGAELDLALLAGMVGLILLGPGRPSLDHLLGIEDGVPVTEPVRAATAR